MLFKGYLKAISTEFNNNHFVCELKIPNKEFFYFYKKTIIECLQLARQA